MSGLKDMAERVIGAGPLPMLPDERLFACERIAALLDRGPRRDAKPARKVP